MEGAREGRREGEGARERKAAEIVDFWIPRAGPRHCARHVVGHACPVAAVFAMAQRAGASASCRPAQMPRRRGVGAARFGAQGRAISEGAQQNDDWHLAERAQVFERRRGLPITTRWADNFEEHPQLSFPFKKDSPVVSYCTPAYCTVCLSSLSVLLCPSSSFSVRPPSLSVPSYCTVHQHIVQYVCTSMYISICMVYNSMQYRPVCMALYTTPYCI